MTLTIEVAPEKEALLARKAQQQGVSVADYARSILEREADAPETLNTPQMEHRLAVQRLKGMLAHLPGSTESFLRERHAEAERAMLQDANPTV